MGIVLDKSNLLLFQEGEDLFYPKLYPYSTNPKMHPGDQWVVTASTNQ